MVVFVVFILFNCFGFLLWRITHTHTHTHTHSLLMFCVAAAAAESLQLCPTLCDPIEGRPPGSAIPGILQARILERVAISFSSALK